VLKAELIPLNQSSPEIFKTIAIRKKRELNQVIAIFVGKKPIQSDQFWMRQAKGQISSKEGILPDFSTSNSYWKDF